MKVNYATIRSAITWHCFINKSKGTEIFSACSLFTLKDEDRFVFKNTVLTRVFGSSWIIGWWERLCSKDLHDFALYPMLHYEINKSENEIWSTCSTHKRDETFVQSLVCKIEWKRRHGRPRSRWNVSVKIDFKCCMKIWIGRWRLESSGGLMWKRQWTLRLH
jgi:hypothetical protein